MSKTSPSFAVNQANSLGRRFAEKQHPYRADFERDRDRIIHSQAFRRLEGKTQVFMPGLDDNYRNRLTHTIEVAQIGRTIAKVLGLNESLTEAICLAHDLGHSPFGHTGEAVLNELMADFGGFEHNTQTVRIVDFLEHPYTDFAGLNLMYETRLGLAKHRTRYDQPGQSGFSQANCSLEGQIADLADRIAYNCHDLEDAMRAEILKPEQLQGVKIFSETYRQISAEQIQDESIRRTRLAKAIIESLVSDAIDISQKTIKQMDIKTIEDVYSKENNLIFLSPRAEANLSELEQFLFENVYTHKTLKQTAEKVRLWLIKLFERLCSNSQLMPQHYQSLVDDEGLERTVCDYIAGMTDRFCLKMLE